MNVHFYPQEMELMLKKAKEYRKKTGDMYSTQYIMTLLTEKYERDLDKDLNEVMDEKVREYEERMAEGGIKV